MQALQESEKAGAAWREALQRRRLVHLLSSAQRIPFWRNRIGQEKSTRLESLPVVTKADMQAVAPEERATISTVRKHAIPTSTSGSTGEPLSFFIDRRLGARHVAHVARITGMHDFQRKSLVLIWPTHNPNPLFRGHFFTIRSAKEARMHYEHLCALISRPDTLVLGLPSSIHCVANVFTAEKIVARPQALLTSGEPLTSESRALFEEVFAVKPVQYYGSRELSVMAHECSHGRYHENSEDVIIEVVDAAGKECPAGAGGRILVTGLNSMISPFIRYEIGDHGVRHSDPCPCGSTYPSFSIVGRASAAAPIALRDGRTILPYQLTGVFNRRSAALRQYQIVHTALHIFRVRIIPTEHYTKRREAEMLAELNELAPGCAFSLERVERIAKGGEKVLNYLRSF